MILFFLSCMLGKQGTPKCLRPQVIKTCSCSIKNVIGDWSCVLIKCLSLYMQTSFIWCGATVMNQKMCPYLREITLAAVTVHNVMLSLSGADQGVLSSLVLLLLFIIFFNEL